jgi:hypothetical protein
MSPVFVLCSMQNACNSFIEFLRADSEIAVEGAFGHEIDYAQLQKLYGETSESEKRYSPAQCIGCKLQEMIGYSDPWHISTSLIDRHNLSIRMTNWTCPQF